MTGQKPATVNHLVLAATHTHRQLWCPHRQGTPALYAPGPEPQSPPSSSLPRQLSRLLHGILLALFSHQGHSTSQLSASLLIPQPFTANDQTFSDKKAFRKSNTPALLQQGAPRPVLLLESHDCCLILQLCQCITLLHVDVFKTDKRGYALPISKAVHVYFSNFLFLWRGKNENVLFFISDYLKFFTVMGGVKMTSTASSQMRDSVACVSTMYIVFFLKQMRVKTYFCLWGKWQCNRIVIQQKSWFDNSFSFWKECLKFLFLLEWYVQIKTGLI